MKDFDAVVFDMDGVIFDSERAVMQCWLELADKYGLKDIETPYIASIGTNAARSRQIMLDACGDTFPYDEYATEVSSIYHKKYDGGRLPMKKGVFEILDFLKNKGKKIALASSTRRQTVVNQLRDANIIEYFDEIISGDMVAKSKPEPDIFLLACEKIDVVPHRAYAVEDSYNGIRAAHSGGLLGIMIPDLLPADKEMLEKSEAVIESLNALIEYFMV